MKEGMWSYLSHILMLKLRSKNYSTFGLNSDHPVSQTVKSVEKEMEEGLIAGHEGATRILETLFREHK